jgi:hypothetical protein
LRIARRGPAGGRDLVQDGIEVIHSQRDMDGPNIARPGPEVRAISRGAIFKEFDFVARCFQDRDQDLSAGNAGDLGCELTRLVGAMR